MKARVSAVLLVLAQACGGSDEAKHVPSSAPDAKLPGDGAASDSPTKQDASVDAAHDSAAGDAAMDSAMPADASSDKRDTTAPEITITGPTDVVTDCGHPYVDPGASATDDTDRTISVTISGADQIDVTAPGRFVIKYTARDAAGNSSEKERVVNVCGPACGDLGKAPIDLSNWKVEQYEQNDQPDASWVLAADKHSVQQTVNADASILLSDFDVADVAVEGLWKMPAAGDDDFVGFVFGYQDRGHFYLFDWKGATQSDPSGPAEVGMSIKRVDLGAFSDGGSADAGGGLDGGPIQLETADLWPTAGSANVRVLARGGVPFHNTIPWKFDTNYFFFLEFHPGSFRITVRETGTDGGSTELVSWSVQDERYRRGYFGFYNYSQGPVNYASFTRRATPSACSTVQRDQ